MVASEFIKVDISQLKVGYALKYDLLTLAGQPLAKSGDIVSENLKRRWRADGIHLASAVIVDPRPATQSEAVDSQSVQPYEPLILERLGDSFRRASSYVLKSAVKLVNGEFSGAREVRSFVDQLQTDISNDVATVLAAFAESLSHELTENDDSIAQRSSQLSVLGIVLASQMGLSSDDQQSTALAGMFHDIALLDCVRDRKSKFQKSDYANHPLDSAWLLESAIGINAKVGLAVSQVHEQVDGTGFPKRLPASRVVPIARILNVADAYLTLTATVQPDLFPQGRNLHPADALGYLMYHAALGRFDRNVVRALVEATSLYPVGSRVRLSDNSTAVVMRSTNGSPAKPIVRMESSHESIVDLRNSNLAITQPTTSPLDCCTRISKSKLPEIYWR